MPDTPTSVKLGMNLDGMRLRTFVSSCFRETIREGHPQTSLVLISAVFCGVHKDPPSGAFTPGSLGTRQGKLIATVAPISDQLMSGTVRTHRHG